MANKHKILLKNIMTKNPYTIDINEPFSRVWELFEKFNIRHLPVIDANRTLKGIVTQRDLFRITSPRKTLEGKLVYDKLNLDNYILKYVMTKEVFSLSVDDTLRSVIRAMMYNKYGCIPVIDNNKTLKGIIAQIDIFKAIVEYFA